MGRKGEGDKEGIEVLLNKIPAPFDLAQVRTRAKDFEPFTVVCLQVRRLEYSDLYPAAAQLIENESCRQCWFFLFQEVERMSTLLSEIRRTLEQVKRGLEVCTRRRLL